MTTTPTIRPITDPQRWAWLGLARFVLASIVAATHLAGFVKSPSLNLVGSAAFEAILGFLAISGFSIAHSYHSRPDGYFKRRVLRIYPVFAASFVASIIVFYYAENISYSLLAILANIVFLNGFITPVSIVWGSWTLAVEVWLYCLAPFLARQSYQRINTFVWLSFLVYCAYTCGRTLFHWPYFSNSNWGIGFICLAFCWMAGWNLRTAPEKLQLKAKRTLAWLFAGVIVLRFGIGIASQLKNHTLSQGWLEHTSQVIWAAIVLALVLKLLLTQRLPELTKPVKTAFTFLGNISYPLYLIHLTVFTGIHRALGDNPLVLVSSALAASAVLYFVFDWYSQKRERPLARTNA